jgi:hypothetical protein
MASFGERKLWDLGLTSGKSEEGKGQRPPLWALLYLLSPQEAGFPLHMKISTLLWLQGALAGLLQTPKDLPGSSGRAKITCFPYQVQHFLLF